MRPAVAAFWQPLQWPIEGSSANHATCVIVRLCVVCSACITLQTVYAVQCRDSRLVNAVITVASPHSQSLQVHELRHFLGEGPAEEVGAEAPVQVMGGRGNGNGGMGKRKNGVSSSSVGQISSFPTRSL